MRFRIVNSDHKTHWEFFDSIPVVKRETNKILKAVYNSEGKVLKVLEEQEEVSYYVEINDFSDFITLLKFADDILIRGDEIELDHNCNDYY